MQSPRGALFHFTISPVSAEPIRFSIQAITILATTKLFDYCNV